MRNSDKKFLRDIYCDKSSKINILWCKKIYIYVWDVYVDNIVISKLVKAKTNSQYLSGYLDKFIRPFALALPKISGYVKTYKVTDRDIDKIIQLLPF